MKARGEAGALYFACIEKDADVAGYRTDIRMIARVAVDFSLNWKPGAHMELANQVAIVTGAASGMDRAIARRSAQAGAEVALMFAAFPSNALTGQSLVVSHGWFMQ